MALRRIAVFVLLTGTVALVLALLPGTTRTASAAEMCTEFDVSGTWNFFAPGRAGRAGGAYQVTFQQDGVGRLRGEAIFPAGDVTTFGYPPGTRFPITSGSIKGTQLNFEDTPTKPKNDGTGAHVGVYRGTVEGTVTNSVSIRASVHGHAYDKQFPASQGNFNGTGPAQCLGLGPKVSIAASPAVTTLLDSEVLRARLTPSTPRASSYKFEIKRPAQAGWTVLRTTPKSGIQFTVKIAGHFKVRVVATVQGRRLFSHPRNLAVRFPSYGKVVSDPRVQAFTAAAWQRTLNRAKPASRREEGFWIGINTCKGRYGQTASVLGPLVGPNQTGSVVLGNRPPDKPLAPRLTGCAVYIIVSFHTHTPTRYRPFARPVGPSAADGRVDAADDVIGIVYDYVANPLASGNVPAHYPLNSPARLYRSGPLRRSTPP